MVDVPSIRQVCLAQPVSNIPIPFSAASNVGSCPSTKPRLFPPVLVHLRPLRSSFTTSLLSPSTSAASSALWYGLLIKSEIIDLRHPIKLSRSPERHDFVQIQSLLIRIVRKSIIMPGGGHTIRYTFFSAANRLSLVRK